MRGRHGYGPGPGPWKGDFRELRDFREFRDEFRRRRGRGGRRQRGDIRTALLALLVEAPGHGYDLIGRLDERSGGEWRPSAGSVYPTLQQLEDEGYVRSVERDGKRVFEVTEEGRREAERRVEEAGGPPWERAGEDPGAFGDLREAAMQLGYAAKQLAMTGRPEQVERATAILDDARKQLYRLLAED